jgi:hypothetical protein
MDTRIILVIGIVSFIYFTKPSIIFKENSEPRHYGLGTDSTGDKKTLFTMEVVIVILILLSQKIR